MKTCVAHGRLTLEDLTNEPCVDPTTLDRRTGTLTTQQTYEVNDLGRVGWGPGLAMPHLTSMLWVGGQDLPYTVDFGRGVRKWSVTYCRRGGSDLHRGIQ